MEVIQITKILMRRWWLVLIPILIVGIVAVPEIIRNEPSDAGGFGTVIRYTAAQQLDAIPNRDGDFQDVWLASELTVNAFTDWVRTSRFAQAVAEEAAEHGLVVDSAAISIAADNQRSVGQIFMNWHDEAQLRLLADSAIIVMQTRSQEAFPQLGGEPAQVVMLDDPHISPAPAPLPNRLRPLLQLAIAAVFGASLAAGAAYFDYTIHERDELERMGLPVIATIPKK